MWSQTGGRMSLRLVKGLVIAMSVALAVGFVVLMVGLARQATRLAGTEDAPPFSASLGLPDGSWIVGIAGAGDAVAVLVERADGSREIHFVDPATGRVLGITTAE